jgi:hypothetical protein
MASTRCHICGFDTPANLQPVLLASGERVSAHITCFHEHHGPNAARLIEAARARDSKEETERTP